MRAGQGCFVVVVGPSGAGKDTLIEWLKPRFEASPDILFVRRTVTRAADAGSEDHDSLDREAFAAQEEAGRFAVCWEAHGLRYGIPAAALHHVDKGGVAIANGSRRALRDIESVFGNVLVVNITVDRAVLADRLAARGRETAEEIAMRLSRSVEAAPSRSRVVTIDNSGSVEAAGTAFVALLAELVDPGLAAGAQSSKGSPIYS